MTATEMAVHVRRSEDTQRREMQECEAKYLRRSLMTETRKRFSSSSPIAPEIEPMAQQRVLSPFQEN